MLELYVAIISRYFPIFISLSQLPASKFKLTANRICGKFRFLPYAHVSFASKTPGRGPRVWTLGGSARPHPGRWARRAALLCPPIRRLTVERYCSGSVWLSCLALWPHPSLRGVLFYRWWSWVLRHAPRTPAAEKTSREACEMMCDAIFRNERG